MHNQKLVNGKGDRVVELGHFDKDFVKNTRERGQENILEFFPRYS